MLATRNGTKIRNPVAALSPIPKSIEVIVSKKSIISKFD
jgi:hypothetical protein